MESSDAVMDNAAAGLEDGAGSGVLEGAVEGPAVDDCCRFGGVPEEEDEAAFGFAPFTAKMELFCEAAAGRTNEEPCVDAPAAFWFCKPWPLCRAVFDDDGTVFVPIMFDATCPEWEAASCAALRAAIRKPHRAGLIFGATEFCAGREKVAWVDEDAVLCEPDDDHVWGWLVGSQFMPEDRDGCVELDQVT